MKVFRLAVLTPGSYASRICRAEHPFERFLGVPVPEQVLHALQLSLVIAAT